MVTRAENDLMTRVEGDAPLGRLMRENYWIPFALSENLLAGDAPTPVRLFGENFVAFRAPTAASASSTSCVPTDARRSSSPGTRVTACVASTTAGSSMCRAV